jgi:histidine phosphotransferase ChpT
VAGLKFRMGTYGMDISIDLRVAELLSSRLCHDLVGPIGAVSNGMELMEDEEFGTSDDALRLASNSARQAADTLQFYRLAYGMAGARLGSDLSELRDLAAGYLTKSKAALDWQAVSVPEGAPDGLGKLLLNMIALADEMLPRGGSLSINLAPSSSGGIDASVTASGEGAGLREDTEPALAQDVSVDDLTPRNVQGYFTRLLARRAGSDLVIDTSTPDSLRFSVILAV